MENSILDIFTGDIRATVLMALTVVLLMIPAAFLGGVLYRLGEKNGEDRHSSRILWGILRVLAFLPPTVPELLVLAVLCSSQKRFHTFMERGVWINSPAIWLTAVVICLVECVSIWGLCLRSAGKKVQPSAVWTARTMGMPEGRIFRKVILPSTVNVLIRGLVAAICRGAGEYGVTMLLFGQAYGTQGDFSRIFPDTIFSSAYGVAWIWAGLWLCGAFVFCRWSAAAQK